MIVTDKRYFNTRVLLLQMIQSYHAVIKDPNQSDHITCCTNINNTDHVVVQCT